MNGKHYVEHWQTTDNTANIAGEIARHLQVRQSLGAAIVFAQRPAILLSAVRKQWIKLSKALQTERSRTLDPALRAALTHEIELMTQLRFTTKSPNSTDAEVFFIEPQQISAALLAKCRTLYADALATDDMREFFAQVQEGSVIVRYTLQK